MSGILSNAITQLQDILISNPRSMGTIMPDCAVEEQGTDKLEITQNPVEQGAQISDHAFSIVPEVTLRWAWSNSSLANAGTLGGLVPQFGASSEQYVQTVYQSLLSLQASRVPFTLVTGKRTYKNMLIADLAVRTDVTSEYALLVTCVCRQLNLVTLSITTLSPATQSMPAKTTPQTSAGAQQATPAVPQSILNNLAQGIKQAIGLQ